MKDKLDIIGNNVLVEIAGIKNIPAKVDTGANLTSVWASDIKVTDSDELQFVLFAPGFPFYTGEVISTKDFRVQRVRNSTGDVSIRYRTTLPITIKGRRIRATVTLSDRSANLFPILIGRSTIQNKFLVDVSRVSVSHSKPIDSSDLDAELQKDPQSFHDKYM